MASKGKKRPPSVKRATAAVTDEKLDAVLRVAMELSHKVNNSLASALNYAFILKEAFYSDETAREILKKIEKGIRNSKDTIQELVDLSHPTGGVHSETVNLKDEFAGIASKFEGVRCQTQFKGSPEIKTARIPLNSLLTILVENSVEAGATVVKIIGRQSPSTYKLIVSDNGPGLTESVLRRAFEPFSSNKAGHKGLGLYTAYHIAKSLGGGLDCLGRREFGIVLPNL